MRRLVIALGVALFTVTQPARAQRLGLELIADGLTKPVFLISPAGDQERVFIVEQPGRVRILQDGVLLAEPFLDVSALVGGAGGERGLFCIAFHPEYATSGRFFVSYIDLAGDLQVAEYRAVPPSANVAEATQVQVILSEFQPFPDHNGGCIQFGPDGMLYVGVGDGGGGHDPNNRAQDGDFRLGKLLRLDVDLPAPFVPADNPFVGEPSTRDEIWALGVRQPWRFSFDRGTGDLYLGDVGLADREEIDYQPASSSGGENYGWRCMEGTQCTGLGGCACSSPALTPPVHEYSHSTGCAVIGGYVYRGSRLPGLQGAYFFGDYCSSRIFTLRVVGGVAQDLVEHTQELSEVALISSFGEDASGELYVLDHVGRVYQVVPRVRQQREAEATTTVCGSMERICTPAAANSSGASGVLDMSGSLDVADDEFTLRATRLPPEPNVGYFVMGAGTGIVYPPGAAGPVCVVPGLVRMRPPASNTAELGGGFVRDFGMNGPHTTFITPGSTWAFQAWFRDGVAATSNFTDALRLTFCP